MRLIDADELKLSHCKECTLYPNQCLKDNCDWDSIYHIKIAKTVEAIPIQFLKEWSEQNEYDETKPKTIPLVLSDWEDRSKENEQSND